MTVYFNGNFIPAEEAFVPITDRGFLFGDGVFTTLRISKGVPEFPELHLARLYDQCHQVNIIPPSISPNALGSLIRYNHAEKGLWRLKIIITGGDGQELYLPQRNGRVIMTLKPYAPPKGPLKIGFYPIPLNSLRIKSLSYLERLHVRQYAQERGWDDAIVLSSEGYLLEGAFSNIFWTYGDETFTPDPILPLIYGVYLSTLEPIKKVKAVLTDIPDAAQIFICNSLTHSIPVYFQLPAHQ